MTVAEAFRFEQHYLECPACIRAVEDAERLHRGLAQVAAEDLAAAAARRTVLAALWQATRSGRGALATGLVLVAVLLPTGLAWQRAGRLGDELATTRHDLTVTRQDLDTARQDLEDERRPHINTPVLELAVTRSGEQPLQRLDLAPEPEWIVLAVDLGANPAATYTVVLTAAGDTVSPGESRGENTVWESPGLTPDYRGILTLSLHSSLLPVGEFVLELAAEDRTTLRFPLQVVAP